ncbi:pseudouridine synthase [Terracidiphilus gabretensis]|uniref:pseudouridine synthase n=1 Tax=Terracidiphilus gabretensis TaxID=1577687 RepID=UPI0009E79E7D|nr:pseudouridine synthase [Terracidiphilus gabretensis]
MDAVVSAEPEDLAEYLLEDEEPAPHEAASDRELYVGVEPPEYTAPREDEPRHEERLQKILAHAGIASRRHAEELIAEGHVQVNGQVITTAGFKADIARDHIRVDGKLLQGSERLRYFILNKPRGFVTTVSDPEGRPTVMKFFERQGERLYPVGRLDYQSEGLLLVTNDGLLANELTRASSGVEKTYLVKVSGAPSEEALERLRGGVAIAKGKPAEGRVRTSPARIRMVRAGENPWYEIVLIEGRNRELRKMFEEIGHRVEKIRRVAYGPLVLDIEAGTTRELVAEEVDLLRLAAKGKFKRRKIDFSVLLPKEAGRTVDHEAAKEGLKRPYGKNFRYQNRDQGAGGTDRARSFPSRRDDRGSEESSRPAGRSGFGAGRPAFGTGRPDSRPGARFDSRPDTRSGARPSARPDSGSDERSSRPTGRTGFGTGRPPGRPAFGAGRPDSRSGARSDSRSGPGREERPSRPGGRTGFGTGRPAFGTGRPDSRSGARSDSRPATRSFERPARSESGSTGFGGKRFDRGPGKSFPKPSFDRKPDSEGTEAPRERFGRGQERPSGPRGGQSAFRPSGRQGSNFGGGRSGSDRGSERSGGFGKAREGAGGRTFGDRPADRSSSDSGGGAGFQSGPRTGGTSSGRPSGRPSFKSAGFKSSGPKPGGARDGFKSGSKPGFKSGPKSGFKSGPKSGPRGGGPRPGSNRDKGRGI